MVLKSRKRVIERDGLSNEDMVMSIVLAGLVSIVVIGAVFFLGAMIVALGAKLLIALLVAAAIGAIVWYVAPWIASFVIGRL